MLPVKINNVQHLLQLRLSPSILQEEWKISPIAQVGYNRHASISLSQMETDL